MSKKTGLKVRDVSKDHFSSGKNLNEPKFSRLVVRMLEGAKLLASDISTGKSDPVCFLWLGPLSENPVVEKLASEEHDAMFAKTEVCPTTVDPIWNEDVVFELDAKDIQTMMDQKCVIFIRDEDIEEDGSKSYDELGMIEFTLKEIVSRGRALKSSIVLPATWYELKKSPGMRRIDGKVKLTISLIFTNEDVESITQQLPPLSPQFSGALHNPLPGVGPLIQAHFKDPSLCAPDPADMRISTSSLRQSGRRSGTSPLRQSSDNASVVSGATSSSRFNGKRPKSAHIVRRKESHDSLSRFLSEGEESDGEMITKNMGRPQTAPNNRRYEMNPLQEEDEENENQESVSNPKSKSKGEEEEEEEEELLVIPSNKNAKEQDKEKQSEQDLLLTSPPPAADESIFHELVGNVFTDGISNAVGLGAEALADHAGDILHFTAKKVGKGVKKVAEEVSIRLPSKLQSTSQEERIQTTVDNVELPSLDVPNKGLATLLRSNRTSTNKSQTSASQSPRLGENDNSNSNNRATGSTSVATEGNKLFGPNPLAAAMLTRLRSDSASSPKNVISSKSREEPHDDHAAYERYKNLHQEHSDLLAEIGIPTAGDQDLPDENPANTNEAQDVGKENILNEEANSDVSLEKSKPAISITTTNANENELMNIKDDDLLNDSQNAQGSATAVVRILREMKQQRQDMQDGLMQLARATEAGFRTLTKRIHHLEEEQAATSPDRKKKTGTDKDKSSKLLLDNGPSRGDEGGNISDLDEDEDYATGKGKRLSKSKSSSLNKTAPATSSGGWKKLKQSSNTTSNFRQFRRQQLQQSRDLYTPVGGGNEIPLRQSNTAGPAVQLVYRDASGGIAAAQVNPQGPPVALGSPVKDATANLALPTIPLNNNSFNNSNNNNNNSLSFPPASPQLLRNSYDNNNLPINPSATNSSLNRDFCEVLDRGSLEDVARLLESSAAKPELLAISTRNRVYDIVSTLLLQRKHTERSLIWVTALLRPTGNANKTSSNSTSIFRELTPHTQRDLLQAVHVASTEASKRGVLASLLYSQIDRAMSLN